MGGGWERANRRRRKEGPRAWGRQLECLWEGVEEALLYLFSLRDRIKMITSRHGGVEVRKKEKLSEKWNADAKMESIFPEGRDHAPHDRAPGKG